MTVSSPSGEPVSAAKIVHLAAPSTVEGPEQSLAARAFYNVYETGEDGTAAIPCFLADDRLQAFSRDGCSRLAPSDGKSTVDLVVEGSCIASGVIYEEEAIDFDGVPLWISCRSQGGQILAQAQAAGSGDWGPMQVPLGHGEQLSFEIAGGKVIPQKVWVPAPSRGGSIDVDFHVRAGADLWFQVYGDAEEILPDATVEVEWDGPDGVVVAKMTPRDDDYIWVGGCQPGIVRYRASAPGY